MAGVGNIVGGFIQGAAAIGGAIARRRNMKKAQKALEEGNREAQTNIDAAAAKERRIENEDGMQLASTQRMLRAIDDRVARRRKQMRNLAAMGMMDEGTAEQLSGGNETAELASQALVQQQQRADSAVKSQEALMGQKNQVIQSNASNMAALHQANANAAAQAAAAIGSQANVVANKFGK